MSGDEAKNVGDAQHRRGFSTKSNAKSGIFCATTLIEKRIIVVKELRNCNSQRFNPPQQKTTLKAPCFHPKTLLLFDSFVTSYR